MQIVFDLLVKTADCNIVYFFINQFRLVMYIDGIGVSNRLSQCYF